MMFVRVAMVGATRKMQAGHNYSQVVAPQRFVSFAVAPHKLMAALQQTEGNTKLLPLKGNQSQQ